MASDSTHQLPADYVVNAKEEKGISKQIEKELQKEKEKLKREVKLLLLGTGDSGKSTFAKQMKILHLNGYSAQERQSFRPVIYGNIVTSMRTVIEAASKLGVPLSPEIQPLAEKVCNEEYFASGEFTPAMADDIISLWKDPAILQTFSMSQKYQLPDSAQYYFESVKRIAEKDYLPDDQDILRSRVRTTGIHEIDFDHGGYHFRLMDVGGQRSERKKWMHCFEGVTAVLFCVAISEYDLVLAEDGKTNRMHESLHVFGQIANLNWFSKSAMLIFFNKRDIFQSKIEHVNITTAFPEYSGPQTMDAASKYIQRKFLEVVKDSNKQIYMHLTVATDTNLISTLFLTVRDIILGNALKVVGL